MGNSPFEIEDRRIRRLAREKLERESAHELAGRIIRLINSKVIRPGPKPEERECTSVASEVEALQPRIAKLILDA
jgi:hypothetical protein